MLRLVSLVSRLQTTSNNFNRFYHVSKVKLVIPQSMDSVKQAWVGKIRKNPGDQVKKSDLIMNIETGKVDIEELALFDGTINEIFVREGQEIPDKTILYSMKTT